MQWAGRTVLVTGGLGFIGSHFVEHLLDAGAAVVCMYRSHRREVLDELPSTDRLRLLAIDLCDEQEVRAACKYVASRLDVLIHCAALDGNTDFKLRHSAQILDTNVRIASNLLNCARERGVTDTVLVSSAEIYTRQSDAPVKETDDYRAHMRYTTNGYVLAKTFTEVLAALYRQQFGMRIFVARPTNVYGPRDGAGTATNRVIPNMLARIWAGEEVEIWGDGRQTRTFIHVADLVRATLRMVETGTYDTINIGTEESVSILELAYTLSDVLGQPRRIRLDATKPSGSPSRVLDVSRMNKIIDFVPRRLVDGLRETASWYREYQEVRAAASQVRLGGR